MVARLETRLEMVFPPERLKEGIEAHLVSRLEMLLGRMGSGSHTLWDGIIRMDPCVCPHGYRRDFSYLPASQKL